MEQFVQHTGIGVPLRRSNVDTDQIFPSDYGRRISRTGYEDALFAQWREDPDFLLNQAAFRHGSVLVAGPDFGTGSSREHAVWALKDYGFRAVLSSRFADIFRGNAGKQGLLAAELAQDVIERLWQALEESPGTPVTVDLETRTVTCGSIAASFDIDGHTQRCLLEGLDDIELTLRSEGAITAYEQNRASYKPTTLPARTTAVQQEGAMPLFTIPYPDGLPIGERWSDCPDRQQIIFPFDGSVVADAPVGTVADAHRALAAADAVRAEVAGLSAGRKRELLFAIHGALSRHGSELVDLLILETGKPRIDCQTEVARTLTTWAASAEEIAHTHGETVPLDLQPLGEGMIGYWTRRPAGVVLGIAGFNYPLLLASHKLAPALAAGCPIILKPAPNTPLATLWAVHLIREALTAHGVSASAVQLVTGGIDVGQALVADPRAAVVSFTGSAAVGHQIARDAAPRKAVLELGSNTGLIVASDAVIADAVDAVIRGGFYANGQACISVQRIVLVESIADEFEQALLARLGEVIVGDPREAATRVAPVINEASTQRVLRWIDAAAARGARVLAGGVPDGRSIAPTVMASVPHDAELWCEEIFGPVVCLERVPDVDSAIALVNRSRYGLQAAIYTKSLEAAFKAINELDAGGVVVNEIPGFRSDIMPYGGVKDSGIGREGPRFAIEEFTVTRMAMIRP